MTQFRIVLCVVAMWSVLGCRSGSSGFPYRFDFGGDYQQVAPGFRRISRVYHSPRFLWVNPVQEGERIQNPDPLMRDFICGPRGEFWIGLPEGKYTFTFIMGDSEEARGPFSISVQGRVVAESVVIPMGQTLRPSFPLRHSGGKVVLELKATEGKTFVLNGLIVEGPPGTQAQPLFPEAPPDELPSVDELDRVSNPDLRATLRSYCDWLLAHRLPNGFLGDYEPGRKSSSYYWYSSAYPIRTLLAGYQLLGENKYRDAAVAILDKLVEEQLPNGAFTQTYRSQPTRGLSKAQIEEIISHNWMNMADVGCIVTALGVAARYVETPRRETYIDSVRNYCDRYAAQFQQPSGGFTNGLERGVPQKETYSVATGTEAAAFTALYAVTKEERYLEKAQRAAEFLLDNWQQDGRPMCYPHRSHNEGQKYLQPVTQFGDMLYYHDGILFVYHQTRDQRFREKVRKVYGWYIDGPQGLLAAMGNNSWWPLQDSWDNSKTAGIPMVFLAYQQMEKQASLDRTIARMTRFLATPDFSRRIGVMVDDPQLPWGGHTLQSWAGCAVAATGFGGLTVAELIQPGVVFFGQFR